jgi:hypothetical protein
VAPLEILRGALGSLGGALGCPKRVFHICQQIEIQFREDVYKAMRLRIESNFPELRNIPPDPADIRKVASVPQLTTPLLRAGSQDDVCLRAKPKYSAYGIMMHGYIVE